jgi:ATP-dependent helicase HepA
VDHRGGDASPVVVPKSLRDGDAHALWETPELREDLLPLMLQRAEEIAGGKAAIVVAGARQEMAAQLDYEVARLRELQKVNTAVRAEEIELLVGQKRALDERLAGARLRLDAVRLIQRGAP